MDLNEIFFSPPPAHIHTRVIPFFLSLTWRVSFLLFENTVPFPPRQITISESRKRERKSRSWGGGLNEMKIRGHLFHLDSFFTLHLGPVFIFAQAEDGWWGGAGAKRCFNGCNLWPVIYRQNGFSSPAQTFLITFPYLSFWGWAGKKKILFKHNFLLESCHVEWDMLEERTFLGPFVRSFHCTITIWWDATIIMAVRNVTHLLFLRGTPVAVIVHFLKTPWNRLMSVVFFPVLPFFPTETENVIAVSKDSSHLPFHWL